MTPDKRKAALLLHALNEQDRAWALSQLTPELRSVADSMLAELCSLGIPADASLIREVLRGVSAPSVCAAKDPLVAASAVNVAQLLQHESGRTVALVLALDKWHWEEPFLAQLEPAFRANVQRMREELSGVVLPASLATTLRAVLQEKLATQMSLIEPSMTESSGGWSWWRKRVFS